MLSLFTRRHLLATLAFISLTPHAPLAHAQVGFGVGQGGAVSKLYEDNCAKCHGDRGQGGGAGTASLLDDKFRPPYADPKAGDINRSFFNSIKNGVKTPDGNSEGMDAYGETMNDAQIWGLVAYIRELQQVDYRKREKPVGLNDSADKDGVHHATHHNYKIEDVVAKGIKVPWAVDWLPNVQDGVNDKGEATGPTTRRMLITERSGKLRLATVTGRGAWEVGEPITEIPKVFAQGQGGLMDVAVHPDYATKGAAGEGLIYLSFSDPAVDGSRKAMTRIIRGKLATKDGVTKLTDQQTIFQAKPEHYTSGGIHFGSKIVFSPQFKDSDGKGKRYIYFTIGDRGEDPSKGTGAKQVAQDVTRPNGKVHRLFDDGTVPADNPFVSNKDAYPSIYTYGHRNPQGLTLDDSGRLWDTEHGPRGGDELNLIEKGHNYGWPIVSFGINYNGAPFRHPFPDLAESAKDKDIHMPTFVWLPSIAACGLDTVRGDAFPNWKGDILAGGLSGQCVERLRVDASGSVTEREEIVLNMGRVRDVATGPDGFIYVVLNDPDKVIRLVPVK